MITVYSYFMFAVSIPGKDSENRSRVGVVQGSEYLKPKGSMENC